MTAIEWDRTNNLFVMRAVLRRYRYYDYYGSSDDIVSANELRECVGNPFDPFYLAGNKIHGIRKYLTSTAQRLDLLDNGNIIAIVKTVYTTIPCRGCGGVNQKRRCRTCSGDGIQKIVDNDRMRILADILEEKYNVRVVQLLRHLRDETANHTIHCWALKILLNQEDNGYSEDNDD